MCCRNRTIVSLVLAVAVGALLTAVLPGWMMILVLGILLMAAGLAILFC